jgi:hypothetical protein
MRSTATTPETYLDEQPADRRAALETVRGVIRANLPAGYEESIGSGMIVYGVPTSRITTPDKKAVWYAALAAQKNFNSLYLMSAYADTDHATSPRGLREGGEEARHGQVVHSFP